MSISGESMMFKFRWVALGLVFVLLSASLAGCSVGQGKGESSHTVAMADAAAMPQQVQRAPRVVRDAYRFAAANPDALKQIPCYCGCGGMGHMSNYNCFWEEGGQMDTHALGCGICVDIAQDVLHGLSRSQSLATTRAQVDADYSRFGPPTDTPPVAKLAQ